MSSSSSGRRLRIAFLTATDPHDRRSWSGLHYMIGQTLAEHVGDVDYLGPVSLRYLFGLGDRANKLIHRLSAGKRYHYSVSVATSRLYALLFGRRLAGKHYDLIFAPAAYTEFAFLKTDIPIVYCGDSTITQLIGYYAGMSSLLDISRKEVVYVEQLALRKASLQVYASRWAANSAIADYHARPEDVVVVPFGSNLKALPREAVLRHRQGAGCELLFVGVEWGRKGGEIALETLVALRSLGIDAHLTICGCVPPPGFAHEKLTVIPFLNKNNPAEVEQLIQLYLKADFFVLPTRAECAGVVFCEASSFGVPSITTDTGGIADFVVEGVNGYRLPLAARGPDFARVIKTVLDNHALYAQLRISSRDLYERELNWGAWGATMKQLLEARFLPAAPALAPERTNAARY